ncbi:MAG: peptidylprolyl isomerase [Bacteroidota bacterium]
MHLKLKKIFITTVLLSTVLTATLAQNQRLIDQVVAVVGDKTILQSDIESQLMQMRAEGMGSSNQRCDMLDQLISQKLLLIQAERDSIEVSNNQIEQQLNMRLRYFIRQIGSKEKLEDYYNKSIAEIRADFRDLLNEQLRTQKMRQQLIQDVTVSPSEVEEYYKNMPEDSIPMVNQKVQIAQIVKYPPETEEAAKEARQRLLELRKRIQDGEKFSTLAVLYSEDRGTSGKGGELGYRTADELDPEFADAAFSLQEDEMSGIVESSYGYHLIKLIGRREDEVNLRHILIKPDIDPEQRQKVTARLDSIATEIRKGNISFEKAAIEFSDDKQYKRNGGLLVNPEDASNEFEMDQLPQADYEAVKDLNEGEVSEPYQTQDDKGKMIFKVTKLQEKTKEHKANLENDFSTIQQKALNKKHQEVIQDWIKEKKANTYIHIDNSFKNCEITVQ